MAVQPRRAVQHLVGDRHGGLDYARLRAEEVSPEEVLDFSVNSNPFGPVPAVREALAQVAVSRYPDRRAGRLRERLAELHGVSPEQILVTNGTAEAIWLVALAYLEPGDAALIVGPTFGEYRVACEMMDARVTILRSDESVDFRPDVERTIREIASLRPRLVWLCNPNNPTGVYLGPEAVRALLAECERGGSLLVLDEAYVNFVAAPWDATALLESGHLALLRSMTKDYALAGLRLGYVLGTVEIVRALRRVQPPWSVNAAAQEVGLVVLEHLDAYREMWRHLRGLAEAFHAAVVALELPAPPTATHFFLIQTGDGDLTHEVLWRHRILVRSCASFGLPAYIRVATQREEENERLLMALRALKELQEKPSSLQEAMLCVWKKRSVASVLLTKRQRPRHGRGRTS